MRGGIIDRQIEKTPAAINEIRSPKPAAHMPPSPKRESASAPFLRVMFKSAALHATLPPPPRPARKKKTGNTGREHSPWHQSAQAYLDLCADPSRDLLTWIRICQNKKRGVQRYARQSIQQQSAKSGFDKSVLHQTLHELLVRVASHDNAARGHIHLQARSRADTHAHQFVQRVHAEKSLSQKAAKASAGTPAASPLVRHPWPLRLADRGHPGHHAARAGCRHDPQSPQREDTCRPQRQKPAARRTGRPKASGARAGQAGVQGCSALQALWVNSGALAGITRLPPKYLRRCITCQYYICI